MTEEKEGRRESIIFYSLWHAHIHIGCPLYRMLYGPISHGKLVGHLELYGPLFPPIVGALRSYGIELSADIFNMLHITTSASPTQNCINNLSVGTKRITNS